MSAEVQRTNIRTAAQGLARVAKQHQLIVSHGNGPQVGLLALQAAAYPDVEPYPLDILGAETQGMIGYLLEQELGNVLPFEVPLATILSMVEVDPDDPAFGDPTKFVGPIYDEATAKALAADKGWAVKPDGDHWRRVVPSPRPLRIFELRPLKWLLEQGVLIICAGGGGIPTMYARGREPPAGRRGSGGRQGPRRQPAGSRPGSGPVRDGHRCRRGVHGLGSADPAQAGPRHHHRAGGRQFPAGSMGPKVEAAVEFVKATGRRAAIGSLDDIDAIVAGTAGTSIVPADA